jgi:hypothetical protein
VVIVDMEAILSGGRALQDGDPTPGGTIPLGYIPGLRRGLRRPVGWRWKGRYSGQNPTAAVPSMTTARTTAMIPGTEVKPTTNARASRTGATISARTSRSVVPMFCCM